MFPRLVIDLEKLRHNGQMLCQMAAADGLDSLAFVTKVFCAMPPMVAALEELPNPYLADSRIENLANYPATGKQKILLRLPMPSQAEQVAAHADISFCSEPAALSALDRAAGDLGRRHKVVLMVDMGDLREGVFFRDRADLLALARQVQLWLPWKAVLLPVGNSLLMLWMVWLCQRCFGMATGLPFLLALAAGACCYLLVLLATGQLSVLREVEGKS